MVIEYPDVLKLAPGFNAFAPVIQVSKVMIVQANYWLSSVEKPIVLTSCCFTISLGK